MVSVFDIDFPIKTYDIPNHPAIRSLSGTSFLALEWFYAGILLKQTQIDGLLLGVKILPKIKMILLMEEILHHPGCIKPCK